MDKAYETKSLKEIASAPISALQGVTDNDAKLLEQAFNVNGIRDLAQLKYFKIAQAIATLADAEE